MLLNSLKRLYLTSVSVSFICMVLVIRNMPYQNSERVKRLTSVKENMKIRQCRALFSISEPLLGYSSYIGNGSGNIMPYTDDKLENIIEKIRKNRQSAYGPDTTEYKKLASWLPSLVKEDKNDSLVLSNRTRVEAGDGYLPHVPCRQLLYSPGMSFSCIKDRLKKKNPFRLTFLGDSKIRNLFIKFLNITKSFDYEIRQENSTVTLKGMINRLEKLRWIDREASSKLLKGFSVLYKFEAFDEAKPGNYDNMECVKLIKSWLSGKTSPPDLVVIGYTTWMLQMLETVRDEKLSILQMEDYLMGIHRFMGPLLEALGHITKVLVLAQSRLRPYAYFVWYIRRAAFSNANLEWSEKMFLHYLNMADGSIGYGNTHFRKTQYSDPLLPEVGNSGIWWWDSSLPLNMATIAECTHLHNSNAGKTAEYNGTWLNCLDNSHAGQATLRDENNMLLNLICNSQNNLDKGYCCS